MARLAHVKESPGTLHHFDAFDFGGSLVGSFLIERLKMSFSTVVVNAYVSGHTLVR